MLAEEASLGARARPRHRREDVSSAASRRRRSPQRAEAGVTVFTVGIASDAVLARALQRSRRETGGTLPRAPRAPTSARCYALDRERARAHLAADLRHRGAAGRQGPARDVARSRTPAARARPAPCPGRRRDAAGPSPRACCPPPRTTPSRRARARRSSSACSCSCALVFFAAARPQCRLSRASPRTSDGSAAARPPRSASASPRARRLMRATERTFGHRQLVARTCTGMLERADVPLRTVEFLYIVVGSAFVVALAGDARSGRQPVHRPRRHRARRGRCRSATWRQARRRLKAFENQLPDSCSRSPPRSRRATASSRASRPSSTRASRRPARSSSACSPRRSSAGRWTTRSPTWPRASARRTSRFVITAVTIQSQVGGSLAGLFDMVAETVRQRQQFARKIKGAHRDGPRLRLRARRRSRS